MNDYLKTKELYHFGIRGMKWGIRRFQNEDGTLTQEGKQRYGVKSDKSNPEDHARDLIKKNTDLLDFAKDPNTDWYNIHGFSYVKHKFPKEKDKVDEWWQKARGFEEVKPDIPWDTIRIKEGISKSDWNDEWKSFENPKYKKNILKTFIDYKIKWLN